MSSSLALLIGLGPLIGWGLFPTIASKFGGKPVNQILGATTGTLIFALIFKLTSGVSIPTGKAFWLSVLSGFGWGFGQTILFKSFQHAGSSIVMPITTAFQLIVTTLWGVLTLGNWPGIVHKVIGLVCLVFIIIGAMLTSWKENNNPTNRQEIKTVFILLLIAVIGQWLYSAAPQAAHISGQRAFLPQAIGMFLTAVIYGLTKLRKHNYFKDRVSYVQIISGFFFAFGAFTYLVSAQKNVNGLATAFVLSQASVILATLTGIFLLHQHKTHKEMIFTIIGLIIIMIATFTTTKL